MDRSAILQAGECFSRAMPKPVVFLYFVCVRFVFCCGYDLFVQGYQFSIVPLIVQVGFANLAQIWRYNVYFSWGRQLIGNMCLEQVSVGSYPWALYGVWLRVPSFVLHLLGCFLNYLALFTFRTSSRYP